MKSNVLIVEDSAEVRSGLQIALEGQGYEVRDAVDGREGITLFREWKPDIVLLDIKMPRMSGIDVCTLIRHESDVPVIMFSGVDEMVDIRLAIQRGASDYVLKDTGFRELLNRVAKHLKLRAAEVMLPTMSHAGANVVSLGVAETGGSASSTAPADAASSVSKFNVQTLHVDAPTPASVESGGVLENLAIVAHSEPESLDEIATVAGRTGYEVAAFSTGQEAVEALAARRPKLVVLGSTLTDMNSMNVVQAISSHPLGEMMAVVLALGRRSPELVRRARYMGVQETIIRPWTDGRLDMAVRSALAATRQARRRLNAA